MASLPPQYSVYFPVSAFGPGTGDFRPSSDDGPINPLVFPGRTPPCIPLNHFRNIKWRESQGTVPKLVIERLGADHLVVREKPVFTGESYTSVEGPRLILDLFDNPLDELIAVFKLAAFTTAKSIGLIDSLTSLCRVTAVTSSDALSLARSATELIHYG